MTKPCADMGMAGNSNCASEVESRDAIQNVIVTPLAEGRNVRKSVAFEIDHFGKARRFSEMEACARANEGFISHNSFGLSELDDVDCEREQSRGEKVKRVRWSCAAATRWMKFNLVGAIGIVVQFAALVLLKSVMHFNYLFATALAVEAAVVHNFIWHERFTWKDRVRESSSSLRNSLARGLRFNLAAGGVSIVGNLALMKLLVGFGHVNYLLANGIAIVLCSLANFLVSDEWVFKGSGQ
jgi:putative flippase GtrA